MSASNVKVNIAFNEWPMCGGLAERRNKTILTFWRRINTSSLLAEYCSFLFLNLDAGLLGKKGFMIWSWCACDACLST